MDKRRQARPPARPPVRASSQKAPARRPVRRPPGKPVKNRKKRPKRDITLAIFEFVANIGGWIKRGYLRARNMRHFRVLSTFAGIAFAIFAVSLVFFLATRPNALEIYLDEASIGTVRLEGAGRDLTLEYITRHAAARLESHLGSNVRFVSEIEANPVRAGTGVVVLTFDNLVTALIDALDYYVFGAVVMVDGDAAATLPSLAAAEDLLGEIAGDLRQGGGAMPFQDVFAQDVDIARGYVRRAELMTRAQAHSALTTPRNVPGTHIVQAGDTFWGIEQATGMSINDIAQANPGVNPANLQVGQIIRVVRTVPILTARDDN